VVTFTPCALPPGKVPGTHWIGGWVGSRAGEVWNTKNQIMSICRHDIIKIVTII